MALPATDAFTGTSGDPLSANWTTIDGVFQIGENNDVKLAGSNFHLAFWDADAFNANQYAQVKVTVVGTDFVGVGVRMASLRGYIVAFSSAGDMTIQRVDGDEDATILDTESSLTLSANDVIKIEVEGTTIRGYQNDVLRVSATDGTYATGSAGIVGYVIGLDSRMDDWLGDNLAAAGSTTDGRILIAPAGFV